ncbi:MAG: sigma-70 family RNA polymerase sigma factor [Deltaproteobacteria bacterium]|nr:sigma-70 family RNA polymerase sigma factor [Deltaproteobacteria bacterium]
MILMLEKQIHTACSSQHYDMAATLVVEHFGPEIFSFLATFSRRQADTDDIFSDFLEDFWRGLPGFQWRCSIRAWAYTLARHAARRFIRRPHRHARRNIPLSQVPGLADAADQVRTTTAHYLRTRPKSRMRELREQLPQEDQTLLVLRVDRGLSWRELAMVMSEEATPPDNDELEIIIPRLRKRFQRLKSKLRKLAELEGLLEASTKTD